MKKFLTGILLAVLVLALAACGTKEVKDDKTSGSSEDIGEEEVTNTYSRSI